MPISSMLLTGVIFRSLHRRSGVCCILVSAYLAARRLLRTAWSTQQNCERRSDRHVRLPRQRGVMTKRQSPLRGTGQRRVSQRPPFQGGDFILVLSRKRGETIQIGDRITITVVRADRKRIKIGIDAPEELRIFRGELDQWSEPPVTKAASAATLFHS